MIKQKVGPVAFKEPKPTQAMKDEANKDFYELALPQFEKLLASKDYLLGGKEFGLIDLVFFH